MPNTQKIIQILTDAGIDSARASQISGTIISSECKNTAMHYLNGTGIGDNAKKRISKVCDKLFA